MTENEIERVQVSLAMVDPDAAAELFYTRLFDVAPQLRALFPGDMTEQKRKLMATIAFAIDGLGNMPSVVPAVRRLGERHARYGATPAHYRIVGETLLWTFHEALGERFTDEMHAAWAKLYNLLSATMQDAARQSAAA